MPDHWRLCLILTVWALIQAGMMYALDRSLVEAVNWVLLLLVVFNCLWGILMAWQSRWTIRLWLHDHVPAFRARVSDVMPSGGSRNSATWVLSGAFVLGVVGGTTCGPMLGMATEQLLWPGANAFRSAVTGMLLAIPAMFLIGFVWISVYARIHR